MKTKRSLHVQKMKRHIGNIHSKSWKWISGPWYKWADQLCPRRMLSSPLLHVEASMADGVSFRPAGYFMGLVSIDFNYLCSAFHDRFIAFNLGPAISSVRWPSLICNFVFVQIKKDLLFLWKLLLLLSRFSANSPVIYRKMTTHLLLVWINSSRHGYSDPVCIYFSIY